MNVSLGPPIRARHLAAVVLALTAQLGTTDASAMSRMGSLEVRLQGDTPCFTITRKERWWNGVPMIHSVGVSAYVRGAPPTPVWHLRLFPNAIRLDRDTCLPYGHSPAGAGSTEAPRLVPWQIYAVGIGGRTDRPSDGTQGYSADFCLVPGEGGAMTVVNLSGESIQRGQTRCHAGSARSGAE
ncbi:hypothetical protein ACFFTM_03530 [Pseudoduganella plicata]|uniref:Uncharacterized protein n=1 Tax=Pseudoduganella plicata TaxID=321984 RepID=A0AA87YBX6_9BURK|nr:hypothetical protein [Pseudoduganella plicata]GGZ08086.1 hypothetical protein GCM10007388_47030 [Pseudoduganella plicata]